MDEEGSDLLTAQASIPRIVEVTLESHRNLLVSAKRLEDQVKALQQRGTELLMELRVYRGVKLSPLQQEQVDTEMEEERKRLVKAYGRTAFGK